jgi:hypothetical protein
LTLSDYLDALTTVREKLTALFMILLEFCTQPAMCLTESSDEAGRASRTNSSSGENVAASLLQVPLSVVDNGDDDKIKSESEVKGFLQDQVL